MLTADNPTERNESLDTLINHLKLRVPEADFLGDVIEIESKLFAGPGIEITRIDHTHPRFKNAPPNAIYGIQVYKPLEQGKETLVTNKSIVYIGPEGFI